MLRNWISTDTQSCCVRPESFLFCCAATRAKCIEKDRIWIIKTFRINNAPPLIIIPWYINIVCRETSLECCLCVHRKPSDSFVISLSLISYSWCWLIMAFWYIYRTYFTSAYFFWCLCLVENEIDWKCSESYFATYSSIIFGQAFFSLIFVYFLIAWDVGVSILSSVAHFQTMLFRRVKFANYNVCVP